jgi:hypothetical protein
MPPPSPAYQVSEVQAQQILELAHAAVTAETLEDLARAILPGLVEMMEIVAAVLYVDEPRLAPYSFFHRGLQAETVLMVESFCNVHFQQLKTHAELSPVPVSLPFQGIAQLYLFPLRTRAGLPLGLMGLVSLHRDLSLPPMLQEKFWPMIANVVDDLLYHRESEKRIAHLNTYLTISSMIAQALDLRDVLEAVLYFAMDALSAEAASVMLLDYSKENLRFYTAEGPSAPVLLTATFPANQGLAGAVLQSQQSEVINDVQHDPRFYGKFDAESGFQTRNMIVIPLTAGEEKIGILEVLNKIGGQLFTDEERLLLQSIAEEIAFAIRNAKLFEVVVKSYCKQRQGQMSCKGCKRPLGSWTPCVKYREAGLEV